MGLTRGHTLEKLALDPISGQESYSRILVILLRHGIERLLLVLRELTLLSL